MGDMEMAALMMLRAAAELYNDSEILRDAVESDEHDQFSAEYIAGESNMVLNAAHDLSRKVAELLEALKVPGSLEIEV